MSLDTPMGKVIFEDDFQGKALDTTNWWTGRSDSGGTTPVILLRQGGVVQMGVDGTDNDVSSLCGNVNLRANAGGGITFEARCALVTSVADGETFIGLSDDSATDEIPGILDTADAYGATAADSFVGFAYTGAGTANWKAVASNATANVTPVACNAGGKVTTPVAGTYQTFKIVVNEDGDADFYINGAFHARLTAAIPASTLMCTHFDIQSGGTARSMYIDYVKTITGRADT